MLVVALAAVGCSDDKKEGGLAVVVESDLSLPKDIDKVRFEVSQDGLTLRTEDHLLGEARLLMPAEFRVKPVGSSRPLLIRAVGFKTGIPRVERSVVTSVPSDYVAMVRLPLTYLCAGTARQDGSSTCGDGQTCKLGICEASAVDVATLPIYQAGPWSGAESGIRDPAGNDCFDVLNCFSQAYRVMLDRDTCTFPVPSDDDPKNVSVGIKLPQGSDGICGAGACWIALDEGPDGWTSEGSIFKLPPALCRDSSDGARLVIVASNMCGGKTLNTPPCGSWSSATHPADTSESIGTTAEGVMETPGDPVGASCAGLSYQPCGDCGQQRRTCHNGDWSPWGECLGQGVCTPNASESCGADGMRVCLSTCDWGDCTGQTCAGMAVEACSNCGTRRRMCTNGAWSDWGICENVGQCAPGTSQACGIGGTQGCMGNCQWGVCGMDVCDGAPSQACGNCGTQARTCDQATKQWSAFDACGQEGACEANQTRVCGLRGMQTCGGNCQWDAACPGQVCEGPASQPCGMCGLQTRTCDSNTGLWNGWSVCTNEGKCLPGSKQACGAGGSQVCLDSCMWNEECTGQLCVGAMTESCTNCGTESRDCDGATAQWLAWGMCMNSGPCNPGSTRRCGSGGTQTCTMTCQWPTTCTGQSCTGESSQPCENCGTQTRTCDGSTGLWSEYGACTGQGQCKPGDAMACGALKSRTCLNTCAFDQCVCVAGATACGDLCVDLKTDSQHCGTCAKSCDGRPCQNSVCACASGTHSCAGTCVLNTSPSACGTSCAPCPAPTNAMATCPASACDFQCNQGFHRCGDACVSNSDQNNCGDRCGAACPPPVGGTAMCINANCVQMCPSGGSTGTNTNCARCGDVCAAGETCNGGACSCPGGGQVGTPEHCSSCTDVCGNGTECLNGACACPTGKLGDSENCGQCDAVCTNGQGCNGTSCGCSEGTLGDTSNCGRCGNACGANQTCRSGSCVCASGTLGDTANCGSCGNACGTSAVCRQGACVCPSGTLGDSANCGTCGNACGNGEACRNGSCECASGTLGDANNCGSCGNACRNGETCKSGACACTNGTLNDNNNCGTCGTACGNGATCKNGACACANGTLNDNSNCGACGNACGNGEMCKSGACACTNGTLNDSNNCGACGTACGNGEVCKSGACACTNGTLNDNSNCGACGNACGNGAMCKNGACSCASGTLNDDNNCGACGNACGNGETCRNGNCACANGTLNDDNNCSACGIACGGGQTCNGETCGCPGGGQLGTTAHCASCTDACSNGESCTNNSCSCPGGGQTGTAANCSRCGDACGNGEECNGGTCGCSGGGELGTDSHCSSCSDVCQNGESCNDGGCSCASGELNDTSNCGTCGNTCPGGTNATCSSGKCGCAENTCGSSCKVCDKDQTCTDGACVTNSSPAGQSGGDAGSGVSGSLSSGTGGAGTGGVEIN